MRALADVYALGGRARRAAAPPQARPRAQAAGEGRPRVRRAHRAARRRAPTRRTRAPRTSSSRSAATPAAGQARRTLVDLQVTTVFPNGLASRFHQVVFQPLTEAAAAAEAREYEFGYRGRQPRRCSSARRASTGRTARIDEAIESGEGAGRQPGDRDVHERAQLLRALPAARAGRRRRAARTASRTWRARNEFADYFGEVAYMQIDGADRRSPSTCSSRRRPARSTSTSRACPVSSADGRGDATTSASTLPRRERPAPRAGADAAALDRGPRPRPRLDLQALGRHGTLVLGPRQGPVRRRRRGAPARRRHHQGAQGRSTRRRARSTTTSSRRRATSRSSSASTASSRTAARRSSRAASATAKTRRRSSSRCSKELGIPATIVIVRTGNKGDFETDAREPRAVRSRDRVRAVARPLPRRHGRVHRLERASRAWIAARSRSRSTRAARSSCTCPTRRRATSVTSHKVDATLSADGAAQVDWRERDQRRRGVRMARSLPRRVDAQAARAERISAASCRASR